MLQKTGALLSLARICAFPNVMPLFTFVQMDIKRKLNNYNSNLIPQEIGISLDLVQHARVPACCDICSFA